MESQKKLVVLGGLGHIGLPLAILLSVYSPYAVVALDISEARAVKVRQGKFPYVENKAQDYLRLALQKGLVISTSETDYAAADAVVIVTGMDVDGNGNPDLSLVIQHLKLVLERVSPETLVVFRSTLSPGGMSLIERAANRITGRTDNHTRLAYCPERTAEGVAFEELPVLPQIISALSEEAFSRAAAIFAHLSPKLIRLLPHEAEYAKLLTNAWRYHSFSLSNHFYKILQSANVDFYRVYDAMVHDYPRAAAFKSPGFAAGPCLLKDTVMMETGFHGDDFSRRTNESMPEFMALMCLNMLEAGNPRVSTPVSHALKGRVIGILGMAFKANVDDYRSSLSYKLRKVLIQRGAEVIFHDPYLPLSDCCLPAETVIERASAIILATPHDCYKALSFQGKPVIDVWGCNRTAPEMLLSRDLLSKDGALSSSSTVQASRPIILVTGSAGFIGGYLVPELISNGFHVIGIDNFSKYGRIAKDYDQDPHYEFYEGDVKDIPLMKRLALRCDYVLACAAMIGGISYFHELAYDLLSENDRIIAATFDAAIHAFKHGHLKKIVVLSSSMVFESTTVFPTPESEVTKCPPPLSTYGFQKLACEYYAKGAWEQYGLPYTIVRPFNCVGVGERRALCDHDIMSGNIKLAMSHVVPDLMQKVLKGQNPLRILGSGEQIRHYTYGGDLARGIRLCITHPSAENNDFNISTTASTTVLQLAELIWTKVFGPSVAFCFESDTPFKYDVQSRIPDCSKAREILGFTAATPLEEIIDELLPWIKQQIEFGNL